MFQEGDSVRLIKPYTFARNHLSEYDEQVPVGTTGVVLMDLGNFTLRVKWDGVDPNAKNKSGSMLFYTAGDGSSNVDEDALAYCDFTEEDLDEVKRLLGVQE